MPEPISVVIEEDDNSTRVDPDTGALEVDQPGGGVVVNFNDHRKKDDGDSDWTANLADDIDPMELARIANELLDAIDADDRSRQGHLQIVARGIGLLGLKLEEPKGTAGNSAATGDGGISSVTNPLLLEAVLKGWANSRAELLPAEGPVKIQVAPGDESGPQDELAEALERHMNYYMTVTASEYVPDTSHMLLWGTYFKGSGFKKVYRCPMRRRPVSESVDAKDFIVSDTTKDLKSCGRITLQIEMRPSVMKRMQLLKAYRKVDLTQPTSSTNVVGQKIAGIQGTTTHNDRPEDQPYNLYETQCELDLEQYAPGKFKDEHIPLPYLVTIDKDSREILSLRRDWKEEDEECERKRMYIKYPYVPGPGFYGTGMLNILGNASAAMTGCWREALDAGMFASFPGGLIAEIAGRQNTSNFRPGIGEFVSVKTGNGKISDMVMALPYRDPTPGLMTMMDKIQAQADKLAGAAEIPASEGLANIPVGTMLAQIEQATKIMSAAHKDMHAAQAEEIELFIELFRDNPEDFWRTNKIAEKGYWNEQKFLQALDDHQLVPRSDPNTPSHLHRVMKAVAYTQIMTTPLAPYFSAKKVAEKICRALKDDPADMVIDPPPQPQGQDLAGMAKMVEAQAKQQTVQIKAAEVQGKGSLEQQKMESEKEVEGIRLQREEVIHRADMVREDHSHQVDMVKQGAEMQMQREQHQQGLQLEHAKHGLAVQGQQHEMGLAEQAQQHEQGLAEDQQQHAQSVAEYQAMNPPAKPKGGGKK